LAVRALAIPALAGVLLQRPAVASARELPLGPRSLEEQRASARVTPGVTWTRIARAGGPWRPRTLAGVRPDGRLLLVTIDGRRPGWSAGVTLPEAARVMRSLAARDALHLDGGGSTTMTVRGAW
jgi:hypothetical protein